MTKRLLPSTRKTTFRFAAASWLLAFLAGCVLLGSSVARNIEQPVFDWLTVLSAPRRSQLPITIVGIDEASFTQLGLQWPWPRDVHARLVKRLSEYGAAVIAFDILFTEPSSVDEDAFLAEAVRGAGNVVLAADHSFHETAAVRQWLRLDPIPQLTRAGATSGLATVELDSDTIARRISVSTDAFWRQVVETLTRSRPGLVDMPYVPAGALMRYLGPSHTFPYVSYYQVLQEGSREMAADLFADQIVLIGRDIRSSSETYGTQGDTFATPFTAGSKLLTPGVEIHATAIENALMGQVILPATTWQNLFVFTLAMSALAPALLFWSPMRGMLASISVLLVLGVITYGLFSLGNLWIASLIPAMSVALAVLLMTGFSYYSERRRAREIRGAFSLYVSPDVVDQMIAHPERLRLGGERRDLTVLFCDLAGFTSIAEKLTPDGVGNLINLYLNEMTQIVMSETGTVDKFIGDAVMAFWGAPLDDPQHALHAIRAALRMQARMAELQSRFAALGVDSVKMRVGIHSGPAIVGNMGSSLRFDYTALGDTVNLASRLEGANKIYGTPILLTGETRHQLQETIALRRIDRVRVKGKTVPVDIYTPCDDTALCAATETAWNAYASRRWEDARTAWSALQAQWPADQLAVVHLERLDRLAGLPPDEAWDGATSLEKL